MKIGILGAGTVARTFGMALVEKGHEVLIGARNPRAAPIARWLQESGANGHLGQLDEAARFGEVIVMAINPWNEIEGVVKGLNATDLEGKPLIDVSNNIEFGDHPKLAFTNLSMGQTLQDWLPYTHVVKTLNMTPASMMANPHDGGIVPAVMWVAGNNTSAKQCVAALLRELGWDDVVDLGGIELSLLQESVGLLMTRVIADILSTPRAPGSPV